MHNFSCINWLSLECLSLGKANTHTYVRRPKRFACYPSQYLQNICVGKECLMSRCCLRMARLHAYIRNWWTSTKTHSASVCVRVCLHQKATWSNARQCLKDFSAVGWHSPNEAHLVHPYTTLHGHYQPRFKHCSFSSRPD